MQVSQYIAVNVSQYIAVNVSQYIAVNVSQYITVYVSQYIAMHVSLGILLCRDYYQVMAHNVFKFVHQQITLPYKYYKLLHEQSSQLLQR